MRMHLATGVPLALALLVGCANAAGDLKSGPQVGDGVGIFEPLGVTGAGKRNGSKFCPVWANGPKPVVMIFAREISDPLTSLVKKVDETNKDKKMGSFVVFLSDDEGMEKKIKGLAEKEKLEKTWLMLADPSGPPDYNLAKSADVTVILYVGKKVKVNRAYKKDEFKADDVEAILKDLPKILDSEK